MNSTKSNHPESNRDMGGLINDAVDLLGRIHMGTPSAEEKTLLSAAAEALLFIWHTGQTRAFQDYQKRRDADAPPPIVAAFATREEAEAWLNNHAYPPHLANVLIADKYYTVADSTRSCLRSASNSNISHRALFPFSLANRWKS